MISRPPEYPFQQVVMDLCNLQGFDFIIYADRYSGWIEAAKINSTSFRTVKRNLLHWFATYGVPEELSSDGGPPFNSHDYDQMLKDWDIHKRLSSAYYPQSNGRAEVAVKSAKRALLNSINPVTGELDTEEAIMAIMTHRNTPVKDTGISPAMALFGRHIKDHLPCHKREVLQEWSEIADAREIALAKRHIRPLQQGSSDNGCLTPLQIGESVRIQNQHGNKPKRWHNTGIISEVLPHRQYRVVTDGSRRITLRNRKFLRPILPVCRNLPSHLDPLSGDVEKHLVPNSWENAEAPEQRGIPILNSFDEHPAVTPPLQPVEVGPHSQIPQLAPSDNPIPAEDNHSRPMDSTPTPRRSGRIRKEVKRLVVSMKGQSYE